MCISLHIPEDGVDIYRGCVGDWLTPHPGTNFIGSPEGVAGTQVAIHPDQMAGYAVRQSCGLKEKFN